ncbi:hypothetical protein RDWZM_003908 [Blomia tropicalis]|uniref:WD repeat domain-containing protein 83 n=1 Tax=Blomia tropicalis TaxID=40697 RepID=A0A9Q0MG36_BLOTA|nr:hypothetical protein RDWZM_003908 [Blomia tropicalis]
MKLVEDEHISLDCDQGAIRKIIYNVDGEYCLTCGSNKTLKLWNPKKKLQLQTYTGHGMGVMDAQCSVDSSQIVSASQDKTVIVWDVSTAQPMRRYRAHMASVNCVSFNEDSSVILSGSVDGTVKIWDTKGHSKEPIQVLDEAKDSISYLAITDHEIASVSLDHHVRRYDLRKGIMESDCLHAPLTYLKFTNDDQCLLVSCLNSRLRLLDKSTGSILTEFKGHLNKEYRIDSALIMNDSFIVSGSEDGAIYIWSLLEASIETKLTHPHKVVHTLDVHPSELELISSGDNMLHVWSLKQET